MRIKSEKQLGLQMNEVMFVGGNKYNIGDDLFKVHVRKYVKEYEQHSKEKIADFLSELIILTKPDQFVQEKMIAEFNLPASDLLDIKCLTYLNLTKAPKNQHYLVTDKANEIISRIKVDVDKFEPSILKDIQRNISITLLCGKNKCFKYVVDEDGDILVMIIELDPETNLLTYVNFRIYPEDNKFNFPIDDPNVGKWIDTYVIEFLQLLFFIEFGEPKYKILEPNRKFGTRAEGKYLNESKKDITIVDSTWNTVSVNAESYNVRGHFRLQPVGIGRKQRMLIFINEFYKKGYIRYGKGIKNKNFIEGELKKTT